MFFKKKEPKKIESFKTKLLNSCNQNTSNIIAKIAERRTEFFSTGLVSKDKKPEVEERFKKMVMYMQNINWESIIDKTLINARLQDIDGAFTDLQDPETAKFLLNLTWQNIKDDMNVMIANVLNFVEDKDEAQNN